MHGRQVPRDEFGGGLRLVCVYCLRVSGYKFRVSCFSDRHPDFGATAI